MSHRAFISRSLLMTAALAALSGCSYLDGFGAWRDGFGRREAVAEEPVPIPAPDPAAPRVAPLVTSHFENVPADTELLGSVQVLFARHENTFVAIARRYNVGFEELKLANPGVDPWLPGEGTPIYLPTLGILPPVARDGIVLNLPAMRLLYFVEGPAEAAEQGADSSPVRRVTSHPIGIGRQGWATPLGEATVTGKARDPVWYPPASVRAEHAAAGDPLPSIVQPGPDNPLGAFAMGLSMPGYLIHGTNKPAGVGMRVSHGCIRLYPEDIEALFDRVPSGTPVRIIDEPVLAGWRGRELYLEVHAPLAEDTRDLGMLADQAIAAAFERASVKPVAVDAERVARIVAERRGIPFPILAPGPGLEAYLASALVVENIVPEAVVADAAVRRELELAGESGTVPGSGLP
ncbi:MAG TPA: L,D-transpeptidase family protein [Gammaproteobacteria bacterium]|nr:L,D-transpeptidase family protein [Gammaproteobacteria bacterium]